MAFATIIFENPNTGMIKEAPVGFSWTTFFFGLFPALLRGDGKWALIIALLAIITFGITNIIFAFIYNKTYVNSLIEKGYKVKSINKGDVDSVNASIGFKLPQLEIS